MQPVTDARRTGRAAARTAPGRLGMVLVSSVAVLAGACSSSSHHVTGAASATTAAPGTGAPTSAAGSAGGSAGLGAPTSLPVSLPPLGSTTPSRPTTTAAGPGTTAPATTTPPTTGPAPSPCPLFPAHDVWNTDISKMPVHARSAQWLASMNSSSTRLHPDFGPSYGAQPVPYGIPFVRVNNQHARVSVTFQYASESDAGPYPFGSDTPIEGGPDASGDRHALMWNTESCTLYELYDAHYAASGSTAGSGAIWDLRSDQLRPAGWTSADAAGLPILPGLLRPDEVAAGAVNHAIRFTAAKTDRSYVWPARHQAGSRSDPTLPPMGARFRLSATFDMSGYRPDTQVVLRAMQHYGLLLADNGSNWYFQGAADDRWDPNLISDLKRVPASAFAAIDESSLMVSPESGATKG